MTDSPAKADPDSLTIRASPQPVTRFSRRVIAALAALGAGAIFAALLFALSPMRLHREPAAPELYTERKQPPEVLAQLPRSYAEMPPAPRLGPPLPGDLGPAVLRHERNLGLAPPVANSGFRPNPLEDSARAERMRQAQQAHQANEAGVFFQLARQTGGASAPAAARPAPGAGESDRLALDPERDQNFQQRKLDFLNRKVEAGIYNPHPLQDPVSPDEILAGTVIAASLLTGLASDLPGLVTAQLPRTSTTR